MSSVRNWAVGSAIAALTLLSRVVAFLIVRVAVMVVELLIGAGALALFSLVTIGALGRLVFRRQTRLAANVSLDWPGIVPPPTRN